MKGDLPRAFKENESDKRSVGAERASGNHRAERNRRPLESQLDWADRQLGRSRRNGVEFRRYFSGSGMRTMSHCCV